MSALHQIITGYAQGGGAAPNPDAAVLALFTSGEQGAWYDPSDFSTMWQDAARTTPVTAVGQPVGAINDKSGRGNHATQATSAARPVLQVDGAGKYYLNFDGVNDFLSTGSIDFTATGKMSTFFGLYALSDAANIVYEISTDTNGATGTLYYATGADRVVGINIRARGDGTGKWGLFPISAPHLSVTSSNHDISANTSVMRRNQVSGSSSGDFMGTGNFANLPTFIGARAGIGIFFSGRIYQIVLRGALTSGDALTGAETYVNSKTGAY
jgi:hypothetical protein